MKGSREIVMFSAGLFTSAAGGSQWDVSTLHAWRLAEGMARNFLRPAPGPAERDQRRRVPAARSSLVRSWRTISHPRSVEYKRVGQKVIYQ